MAKRKSFSLNKDLTQGLAQTMNAVKNYAGSLRYEVIPLSNVELDPDNPRELALNLQDVRHGLQESDSQYQQKLHEMETLNSLTNTIRSQGIINPIIVYKHGANYRLIAGERRCLASVLAKKKDIKANILNERPSELNKTVMQWIENIEREDLTLWERIRNVKQLVSAYTAEMGVHSKLSASILAQLLGCSLPHAMNYHAVLNAPEDIKNYIRNQQIQNLEKAAILVKIEDKDLRDEAIQACLAGATIKVLKNMVKRLSTQQQNLNNLATRKKLQSGRGRQATKVNLGSTNNITVVKHIMEVILQAPHRQVIKEKLFDIDWHDYRQVSVSFKSLMGVLERELAE